MENYPGITTIYTRIDDYHSRRVSKQNGEIVQTLEGSESADGKTRTQTRKGKRANGEEFPQPWIEVYGRQ